MNLAYKIGYLYTKIKCTLGYFLQRKPKNQKLAIHCLFQNETEFLREWLDYHFALGFDHIMLSNDASIEDLSLLQPYLQKGLVSLEDAVQDRGYSARQEYHQNRGYQKLRKKYQWIAFIDTDEFIYSAEDLKSFLKKKEHLPGLVMNFFMYGTSHKEKLEEGEFLIEQLTYRFEDDHNEHFVTKAIVQSGYGFRFYNKNPHYPQYAPMAPLYWCDGIRFQPAIKRSLREPLSLNHYWYRTEKYYREVKIPRRKVFEKGKRPEHVQKWHRENANAVRDARLASAAERIKTWRESMNF